MRIAIQSKTRHGVLFLLFSFLFTITAFSQNCSVNAGINATLCNGQEFVLNGNVGGPTISGTIAWSVVSQPSGANVVFNNPGSLHASGGIATVAGNYTFRLTATCGDGITSQDDVVYTVGAVPALPSISGVTSFSCYVDGTPINLSGTAPVAGETVQWSVLNGNGGTFSSPNSNTTTFIPAFPADECSSPDYEMQISYTITNSSGCKNSTIEYYTFTRDYGVWSKANPSALCGTSTSLKGSCPGDGSGSWSIVSKPVSAPNPAFTSSASRNTNVTGLVTGNYTFRYTVSGSTCSSGTADVNVTVSGTVAITIPDAGKDQYYCTVPGSVSLTGTTPAVGETVSWSQLSGGTTVTFTNPTSANTAVNGLTDAGAPYSFIYYVTNGNCDARDTVGIYKTAQPSLASREPSEACYGGSGLGPYFGDYLYKSLDTVRVTATYLSGPSGAPSAQVSLINRGSAPSVGSGGVIRSFTTINKGQSFSWTLTGSDLYANIPFTDPVTAVYSLGSNYLVTSAGIYRFRISYTTQCGTYESESEVYKGFTGWDANAGTDLLLACNTTSATLAGNYPNGDGQWRTIQMPAGATNPINSANQNLQSPPISGLISGTYLFAYGRNPGPTCTFANDQVKLTVASTPPATPDAGVDKTTCAGTTTLNGSAIPDDATGLWQVISPASSGITFSAATSATTQAIGLQPSTVYVFRYTLTNGCGSSADDITVTTTTNVNPEKPLLDVSHTWDCGNVYLPNPSPLEFFHPAFTAGGGIDSSWRVISYPAGIGYNITPIDNSTTDIEFPSVTQSTAVSVIYTLSNSGCPAEASSDTLSFYFWDNTSSGYIPGGVKQYCAISSYPFTPTLAGSSSPFPVLWTNTTNSNGQATTITDPSNPVTTVSLPADGVYNFLYQQLNPLDPACNNGDGITTQIIASSGASTALAGDDISFCNGTGSTNLAATPLTSGTGQWQVYETLNGLAPVITTPSSATSAIQFSQSGSVVLKWNAYGNNPECGTSSSDLVTVTYTAPASAGNDQELCQSTSTNLNALSPSPATGASSQITGPIATIADANSPQTVVTGLTNGTYTFRWSVSGGSCSSMDDVTISVSSISDQSNAGSDFGSCSGGTNTIKLHGTTAPSGFTGTWLVLNKPSGAATGSFSDVHDPASNYTGVSMQGKYVFGWTINDGSGSCSSTDYVEVTAGVSMCTLPVELGKFSGTVNPHCNVDLNWQSQSEQNVLKYIIERSEDGINYKTIREMAASGNSTTVQNYNFTDITVSNNEYFYRIKMTDRDGKYKYSGVVHISLPCFNKNSLSIVPNPVQMGQSFKLKIVTDQNIAKGLVSIKNTAGQVIHTYPVVVRAGTSFINYPAISLSGGTYFADLSENNKVIGNCKVVVQ